MSHVIPSSSARRTDSVARMTQALRKSWTQARLTDRELMSLRTNLSRHAG